METLRRRFLVTVGLFMLMVTLLFVPTMTGRAQEATPTEPIKTPPTEWEEQPAINPSVLDNTQASCEIYSKEDLYGLNDWIKNNSNTSLTINLNADVVVNTDTINASTDEFSVYLWTPIDVNCDITFNGNGHTISGLYCNDSTKRNVGFFGACEGVVQISKLGIVNSYFYGSSNVGTFAGTLGDGSAITECYSHSIVSASDVGTQGGIAAVLEGSAFILSCYNTENIKCVPESYNANVQNSCYITTNASELEVYKGTGSAALTEEEFKSGAAAFLLSGGFSADGVNLDTAWGQKLIPSYDNDEVATANKSYPVFSSDKVTLGKQNCKAEADTYINADTVKLHYHGNIERHIAKKPTCTENGNDEYYLCTDCSAIVEVDSEGIFIVVDDVSVEDYVIKMTGHEDYNRILVGSKVITKEDGSTSHGHIWHFVCKKCGVHDVTKDEVINADELVSTTTEGTACTGITTIHYCAECGYNEKINIEATGEHTFVTYCTEGYHWTMCSSCKTIIKPKESHVIVTTIEAVAATCTKDGNTAQVECEGCKRVMSKSQVVKATGHRYGDWEVTTEADCEKAGEEQRVCILCDGKDTKTIEALGHEKKTTEAKAATCMEEGNAEYSVCSRCSKIFDAKGNVLDAIPVIEKKEHVLQTIPGKKATCTENGLKDGKNCISCNNVIVEQEVIPATGHDAEDIAGTPATCTTPGLTAGKRCRTCGEILVEQKRIDPAHKPGESTSKAPTCVEDGYAVLVVCTVCNTELQRVPIAATGHTEVIDEGKAATCVNTGLTEGKHCSVCKVELVAQEEIEALGHDWIEYEKQEATCMAAGHEAGRECRRCDVKEGMEEIAQLEHTSEKVDGTPATCEEDGFSDGSICSVCKTVLEEQKIMPKTGHTWIYVPEEPATCTKAGHIGYTQCSECKKYYDETLTDENIVIQPLEHNYMDMLGKDKTCEEDGFTAYKQCIVCNHEEGKEILPAGHKVVVDEAVAATCTQAGKGEGTHCSVCNKTLSEQETIPALNHMVDGVSQLIDVPEVKATCMAAGTTAGKKCTLCNTITEGCEPSDKLSHQYNLTKADVTWIYDSEINKITATATINCEYKCGTSIADIPCTVTVVKNLNGTLKVSGIFNYKGQTETREFNVTLKSAKWIQTDSGFNVEYTYTNVEKNIEIVVTSEAVGTISGEDIIYTAASVVDNIKLDTVTHTFNKAAAQYSWTKTADGYSFIATVDGKTKDDGILRLVQKATSKTITNESGEVVSTVYNAVITIGDVELKADEKTIANISYTVTLQGNAAFVNSSETSISASYLQLITVTCGKEEGKVFAGWYVNDELVSSKETYSFYVKDSIALEARFSEQPVEAQAVVSFSVGERVDLENGKQTIAVAVDWEIPEGCTLVETGFRRIYVEKGSLDDNVANAENVLKEKGENVKTIVSSLKENIGTLTSTLTLSAATKVKNMYTIAYIIYTNKNGEQQTLYSKCIASSYSVNR